MVHLFMLPRDMNACYLNDKVFITIKGFLDTLSMINCLIPGRKSYKLFDLAQKYLSSEELKNALDALCDVKMLEGVIWKMNVNSNIKYKHSVTLLAYILMKTNKKS